MGLSDSQTDRYTMGYDNKRFLYFVIKWKDTMWPLVLVFVIILKYALVSGILLQFMTLIVIIGF